MEESIRVLLVDDHPVVCAGLRLLIESRQGLTVVGEAANLAEALAIAARKKPDVILLDLLMGRESGLDYIRDLVEASEGSRILILTAVQDAKMQRRAIQMGAMGLLSKETTGDILIKAIEKVHQGEAWIDRVAMASVLAELSKPSQLNSNGSKINATLSITKREREVITLVARGYKNKQVAEALHISNVTVRHHMTSIFSKLSVADRFELIIYAYENGLADVPGKGDSAGAQAATE